MKVEQLFVQYLYSNKTVSIQEIGIFTISPEINIPADNEKEGILPPGAIQFEYNPKAAQDDGLVDFIVQHSRKIKPLAVSDLESYSLLSKQFLNIGKPLVVEGLGTITKTQKGDYEFVQGHSLNTKLEKAKSIDKESEQEDISFTTPAKEPSSKKGLMIMVSLMFIISAAAAVYYFTVYSKKTEIPFQQPIVEQPVTDSVSLVGDSALQVKTDSAINPITPQKADDGYSFKIVIKEYPTKEKAQTAYSRLTSFGHTVYVAQKDSNSYKLIMPFTTPVSDSVRARDSLKIFFGGNPYIEQ